VSECRKVGADGLTKADRKVNKWRLQSEAGQLLPTHRVKGCSCRRINKEKSVEVYSHREGGSFYGNLQKCGSVWVCPVCAPKITERRRTELEHLVKWVRTEEYSVFLLSLTIPHSIRDNPKDVVNKLGKARKKLRQSRTWKSFREAVGVVGSVRALEAVYGKNGIHPHFHDLLIVKVSEMASWMSKLLVAWQSACLKAGLPKPNKHGVDIRNGEHAANYVGKWGIESELTRSQSKMGAGRTAFDLLRDAANGDVEAGRMFQLHAEAFKGKRQLVWSGGLRKLCGLDAEKTDKELAEEVTEEQTVLLGELAPVEWCNVYRFGLRGELLAIADCEGWAGVQQLLAELRALAMDMMTPPEPCRIG
jgi:hypothetical protein